MRDLATLTAEQLAALGLEVPRSLADFDIPLWRSSTKHKYHWADERSSCQHLPGYEWERRRGVAAPVSDRVPALGFSVPESAMCLSCAQRIAISPQADVFIAVAAELARFAEWTSVGRSAAADGDWTWLQFARWRSRQPLQGDRWAKSTQSLRGPKWSNHALELRCEIRAQRAEASAAIRLLANSIQHDATRTALLERAVRMVETDSNALSESDDILVIAGFGRRKRVEHSPMYSPWLTYDQPSPWQLVAGWWYHQQERHLPTQVDEITAHLDGLFPHVHDLRRLNCVDFEVLLEPGDCVHTWAARTAQVHRHATVRGWINRLNMALEGIAGASPTNSECTHLVVVDSWPLTTNDAESIAYLTQFDIVCGPFAVDSGYYEPDQVAVLRVPEWAAAHVGELPRPMRCEPITDEPRQAIVLARSAGVPILDAEFTTRRKPSQRVVAARDQLHEETSDSGPSWQRRGHRPLRPGAPPPEYYGDREWTTLSARHVLQRGAVFIYGHDDVRLLKLALPDAGHAAIAACAAVEVQTKCVNHYHNDEPHVCEIDGTAVGVRRMPVYASFPTACTTPLPSPRPTSSDSR